MSKTKNLKSDLIFIFIVATLEGMSSFLSYRNNNNTLIIEINDLKELVDVAGCDSLASTLRCIPWACESKIILN